MVSFTGLTGIDTKKYFQVILFSFLAVQLISWAISSVSDTPILKGGSMLFLFGVAIFLVTLYSIGRDFKNFDLKRDGLLVLLVFIAITLLFIILPIIIPEIFSTSGVEFREFMIRTVGQVVSYGGTGVV